MNRKKINFGNVFIYMIFIVFCIFTIYPIWCIIVVSLTGKEEIAKYGFSLWMRKFDISAYMYLLKNESSILSAYGTTIAVSVVGTIIGCQTSIMYAYVLSRRDFRYARFFSFFMLFTMFFNGGMAASYIVNVSILNLKNSFWVLVLPIAFVPINVIIARAYFMQLPFGMIESAKIDGAGEYTIFYRLIVPLSKPAVATICLTLFIGYWNSYYQAMMYMDTGYLVTIQLLLHRLLANLDFLKSNAQTPLAQLELSNLPSDSVRMAVCVITVLPTLLVFPRFQKYFVKGMAIGAVKE